MIKISIPNYKELEINHLCLDFNGTLAYHGTLKPHVAEVLMVLAKEIEIHVLTADTFCCAEEELKDLPINLVIIPSDKQAATKLKFVENLGFENAVCVGNGRNDAKMLKEAAVGIVIIQEEGAAVSSILNADIACHNIEDALHLLLYPNRMIATLRS